MARHQATPEDFLLPSPPISPASTASDVRLAGLYQWLSSLFTASDVVLTVASADASFRRYFRVACQGKTYIAMDAPPAQENVHPFIRVSQMLVPLGVNAPRVLAQNLEQGYLLLTDLGDRTYLAELEATPDRATKLYGDALSALAHMQSRATSDASALPAYDRALLQREVDLFPEWFVTRHLGCSLDPGELAVMQGVSDVLINEALQQPQVFVHRDYHSRNLMVCDGALQGSNPGVLDFQDAVFGPVTYDLVSLLRDCYIDWPEEQVVDWAIMFRTEAIRSGVNVGDDATQFVRWFDLMGVQRHLKAIGIFSRLWHRDGKRGYLKDIPRTLGYVRSVSVRYPELREFAALIENRVTPALQNLVVPG
jgi:aminoglycoside/choline kinase family phosphotransferase